MSGIVDMTAIVCRGQKKVPDSPELELPLYRTPPPLLSPLGHTPAPFCHKQGGT